MRTSTLALVAASIALAACGSSTSADVVTTHDAVDATGDAVADHVTPTDVTTPTDVPTTMDVVTPTDVPVVTDSGVDTGPVVDTCQGTAATGVWTVDASMCVTQFANGLMRPRGLLFASNGDLFVNDLGRITVLHDDNHDGTISASERTVFGTIPSPSGTTPHGLAFSPDGAFLYASNVSTVYRWPYSSGLRTAAGNAETVIAGIPTGGHNTRTLVFDATGRLYVSVGSNANLDQTASLLSTRAMIRRFTIPATIPNGGMQYSSGESWVTGMRNEVGLFIDRAGRMWGVENGRDNATFPDSRTDVHYDNPGEELNLITESGSHFYGYPSCWSEGAVLAGGGGPGTQHGDPQSSAPAPRNDAWCQDPANVHPPAAVMPAHWAPLGITEYFGSAFPADWNGDLIITSHGSWNSERGQVGRLLARAHLASDGSVMSIAPIVGQAGGGGLSMGSWNARPVDVRVGPDGAIYFSDDQGGRIFRVGYHH